MPGSEIFGWIIMGCGTVALIAAIDFIQRNLPDALAEDADDKPHGDWPHVPTIDEPRAGQ